MRQLFFLLLCLVGTFAISQNRRVGIGTTSPVADLDLVGDTLGFRSAVGSWDNLWFHVNDSTAYINASGAEAGLRFRVGSNATGAYGNGQTLYTAMTMLPNGRIGIGGVTAPVSLLSNTTKNTVGADANGGNPGSFSWLANQSGYAAQIFNEGSAGNANGLAVKVLSSSGTAFDVSTGTQDLAGTSLFNVKSYGRVGIGTSNPVLKVDVIGGGVQQVMRIAGGNGQSDNNGMLIIHDSSNNTGVNGNNELLLFLNAPQAIIGSVNRTANANSISFNTTSDTRLKTDIRPTRYGLKQLMQIEVADYKYKGIANAAQQTGFLAQQLYQIYPEAVAKGDDTDEKKPYMVDYGKLTPLLVKAMQEMNAKVEALEKENKSLRVENARISELATQLQQLQQSFKALSLTSGEKTAVVK